ncbi:hypothetical protein D3C81_1430300 [compost metagenome]
MVSVLRPPARFSKRVAKCEASSSRVCERLKILLADSRTLNSSGEVSRISSTEPETNWNSSEISLRRARASRSSTWLIFRVGLPCSMPLSTWPKRVASRPKASAACWEFSSPASTVLTAPRIRSASSD